MVRKIVFLSLKNKLVAAVLFLSLILRVWGVSPGFHPFHPDEPQLYSRAWVFLQGREHDFGYMGYPALGSIVYAIFYALFFFPAQFVISFIWHPANIFSGHELDKFVKVYVAGMREINILYWGRYTSVILSVLTVFLTYVVGKRYFSRAVGILAALFLAVNYGHVLYSHLASIDVVNSFFFTLAYLPVLVLFTKPTYRNYFLTGLAAAASISVKLSPFVLVAPVAALLFRRQLLKAKTLKGFAILLLCVLVSVLVINFYHIIYWNETVQDLSILSKRYVAGSNQFLHFPYLYLFNYGLSPVITILLLIGIIFGIKNNFLKTIILLLPVVLLFVSLTFLSIGGIYVRNFLAAFPVLLIFSSLGLVSIFNIFKKVIGRKISLAIALSILVLGIYMPLENILVLDQGYSQRWNYLVAREYMSFPEFKDKTIAAHPWTASLILPDTLAPVKFGLDSNFSVAELQEAGADYALVDLDFSQADFTWWFGSIGPNTFQSRPDSLLYSTFSGSALRELLNNRIADFVKPWQAPEYNMFLIRIPSKENFFKKGELYQENFDKAANWQTKNSLGQKLPKIGQIFGEPCGSAGCVTIGSIDRGETGQKILDNQSLPRFSMISSPIIKLEDNKSYKATVEMWTDHDTSQDKRTGFFKVELFRDNFQDSQTSDVIFVSSRLWGEAGKKQLKTIDFVAPPGYNKIIVSFQKDRNRGDTVYFDNLRLEKGDISPGDDRVKNIEENKDNFPKEVIFTNSIL